MLKSFLIKRKSSADGSSNSGTGCAVLFGLAFAGMGILFMVIIATQFMESLDARGWQEVPAELIEADIAIDESDEDSPFSLQVRYQYRIEGRSYESEKHRLQEKSTDDYRDIATELREMQAAGDGMVAYVDPENPENAVIDPGSLLGNGLMMLFPVPFILIGLGIAGGALYSRSRKKKQGDDSGDSLSSKADSTIGAGGQWILFVVFGVFFLVGLGMIYPLCIRPIAASRAAASWPEVPCKILWSRIQSHSDEDGTTYSVDIFYEYTFEGKTLRSNRYEFFNSSSSGRGGKKDVIKQYPKGSTQVCYVDPEDPLNAVLKRELGLTVLFGLLPLVFALVGGGGLVGTILSLRKKRRLAIEYATHDDGGFGFSSGSDDPANAHQPTGSQTFRPGGKRIVSFLVASGICVFWNGIVSVFLWQIISGFRRGAPEWFMTIFIIPFVLIGLVMIGAVVYTLLLQFNPKPVVTLRPHTPRVGETLTASWQLSRGSGSLRNLRLLLVGTENATYRRGTNTRTDTSVFYSRLLAEAEQGIDLYQNEGSIELPHDLCPSLDLGNNKIEWQLRLQGDIPYLPDIDDSYTIVIKPARRS